MPQTDNVIERVVASDLADDRARSAAAEPYRAQVAARRRRRWGRSAAAVAVACAGAAGFLAVTWLVDAGRRKRGTRLDRAVLRFVQRARNPQAASAARAVSFVASIPAVLAMTVTTGWIARRTPRLLGQLVAGACGGIVTEVAIKRLFHRDRPAVIAHLAKVSSSSFPSGHSTSAASFFLTIALVATRNRTIRKHRVRVITAAALAACAVGASRVYLGVHWPTDVLGGLALGTAWACAAEAAFDFNAAKRLTRPTRATSPAHAKPRVGLVLNPGASCAGSGIERIQAELEARFDLDVFPIGDTMDPRRCVEAALERHPSLVIAAGGDGTVSAVAGALFGKDVALGVLPLGTSNSIAASLGIPGSADGALSTFFDGASCLIDSAEANGRTMLLHASIGLHAAAVGNAPSAAKQRWGGLAYVREALAQVGESEPFDVEIVVDDAVVRCRATNVMVANMAPPKTVLAQGPRASSPEDGMLDVTIVSATTLAEAVITGMHLFRTAVRGECATRDNVGFLSARAVRIVTSPAQPILVDGEAAGAGTLVARCRPRSLRVLVPRERDAVVSAPHERKLTGLPDLEIVPLSVRAG